MKKIVSIACLFAAAALLAGCPKKATTVEPPSAGSQVPGAGGSTSGSETGSTSTSPLGGDASALGGGPGGGPNASVGRVIYFDFDKSDIRPEFAGVITGNAQFLAAHPGAKIKLEGNTDERGTREYNIGLGERRAQAAKNYLISLGITADRMDTVSWGKERPFCTEQSESCWQQNRRAHFVAAH